VSAAFDIRELVARALELNPPIHAHTVAPEDWQYLGDLAPTIMLRLEFRRAPRFNSFPSVAPRAKATTARPSGSRDAPEWSRCVTALGRWFERRASSRELTSARAHELDALLRVPSPWPHKSSRYRPERARKETPSPTFTAEQLTEASAMIETACKRKGALVERAWLELKYPPKRCRATSSLRTQVERAIERAQSRLRRDACARNRRGSEASIRLGGRAPSSAVEHDDQK
jgi:hypothetical protein